MVANLITYLNDDAPSFVHRNSFTPFILFILIVSQAVGKAPHSLFLDKRSQCGLSSFYITLSGSKATY
jgi:hypothetical protein